MDVKLNEVKAIVVSGGGPRGINSLGCLHKLSEKGLLLSEIDEYAGTSIGSVICLLLYIGCTPCEIFRHVLEMKNFFPQSDDILSLVSQKGLVDIRVFSSFVMDICFSKTGLKDPTFEDLYKHTDHRMFTICGGNLSKMKEERYSYTTTPSMKVRTAIEISCCLPLVFKQLTYKEDVMVDGGFYNNYPWNCISEGKLAIGILTTGNLESYCEKEMLGYIIRALLIPLKRLDTRSKEDAPDTVLTFHIESKKAPDISSIYDMSIFDKTNLFVEGYKLTKI